MRTRLPDPPSPRRHRRRSLALAGLLVALPGAAAAADYCGVERVSWQASGANYEPAQTVHPGGPPRHVSDDRVRVTWWPRQGRAELEWKLRTHYPFPTEWRFTETLTPDGGAVEGSDGFRSDASAQAMPAARRMARMSDLWLRLPGLLATAGGSPPSLGGTAWRLDGGDGRGAFTRARSEERDPPWPERAHTLHYGDWHQVAGLAVPGRVERRVGGELIRRETLGDWQISRAGDTGECRPPAADTRLAGAAWATGLTHWLLRRAAMGAHSNVPMASEVTLHEVADGIFQVRGSSHHTLVVLSGRHIVLGDAPLYPERSEALLQRLAERWPERSISHVVLTHHHHDHSGGLIPFVRAGASPVVAAAGAPYIRELLRTHGLYDTRVIAAGERHSVAGLEREVATWTVPNGHADGMLVIHVPEAEHVFVSDLYSPGRAAQHPLYAEELCRTLTWHGLTDISLSGGHGRGAEPFAALAEWVADNGETARRGGTPADFCGTRVR